VITIEQTGTVAVVTLSNGKVNTLDVSFLDELAGRLSEIASSGARAVVVTGEGRAFSAGVDLVQYLDGGGSYTARLIPALAGAFNALFDLPLPTVAAVNGAAIAGGCILVCACDRRILASGARIGATELAVGVAFPAAALEIIRHACGDRAEDVILGAGLHEGAGAVAMGLAHEVVPGEELLARAVETAERMGEMNPAAFRAAKAQLHGPARQRIDANAAAVDAAALEVWCAPETIAAVRAAQERTARR
jgi:enoyl-CoA hydratase/carnithine racemase